MTFPPDYRDSRADYNQLPLLRRYERQPENEPLVVPDEAPFPIWIVPPGWRMARLSDITQAAGIEATPENVEELLEKLGVRYNPRPDIAAWGWKEPLVTWNIRETNDSLVLWQLEPEKKALPKTAGGQ